MNTQQALDALLEASAVLQAEHDHQVDVIRHEVTLEIVDSVRFERANLPWTLRAGAASSLGLSMAHELIPDFSFIVKHACEVALIGGVDSLSSTACSVAVNPKSIMAIRGLGKVHGNGHGRHGCLASWLVSQIESGETVSIFTNDQRAQRGRIIAANSDAIDVLVASESTTIPWAAIALVRVGD